MWDSIQQLDNLIARLGPEIHFNGVVFHVDKPLYRDKRIFRLIGSDGNDCLKIMLTEDGIGIIDWVANSRFCNTPESKGGTWLVNLADSFIQWMGAKEATLIDAAMIKCEPIRVSLLFVRIYSGIFSSWYENFGFIPVVDVKNQMRELYYASPKQFEIEELPAQPGETLGPYMKRLLQFDCELYYDVQNQILHTELGFEIATNNQYYKFY